MILYIPITNILLPPRVCMDQLRCFYYNSQILFPPPRCLYGPTSMLLFQQRKFYFPPGQYEPTSMLLFQQPKFYSPPLKGLYGSTSMLLFQQLKFYSPGSVRTKLDAFIPIAKILLAPHGSVWTNFDAFYSNTQNFIPLPTQESVWTNFEKPWPIAMKHSIQYVLNRLGTSCFFLDFFNP